MAFVVRILVTAIVIAVISDSAEALGRTCSLPKDEGPCYGNYRRFYYDESTGHCRKLMYGGCRGNANNFRSLQDCRERCSGDVCTLPPQRGDCTDNEPRYYYDKMKKQCEKFIYSGCGGNGNSFETVDDCEDRCKVDVCTLPSDSGECDDDIPRFYYNKRTKRCYEFSYGGCGGNDNNFERREDCENSCIHPCSQPKMHGNCLGKITSYHYNKLSHRCEKFDWGGCQKNSNNFESESDCKDMCRSICYKRKDSGPCQGKIKRYYYNWSAKKCMTFTWGGCEGNGNNFRTMEECENECVELYYY